jgi:hypothetical protein
VVFGDELGGLRDGRKKESEEKVGMRLAGSLDHFSALSLFSSTSPLDIEYILFNF